MRRPMSEAEKKSREQAARDLQDIAILHRSDEFNRYYLRRMAEKRKTFADAFLTAECSHEKREILRQMILLFDELGRMMKEDEAAFGRMLA